MLAVGLLAVGLVGALARPRNLPAWLLPVGAALVAIAAGVVGGSELHDVLSPLAAPLAFVLVAVPLAASLDDVGVFDELASFAARSRHVVGALWILAGLVVALLNLDAAVVLLTPIYVRTALLVDVDPVALAFQPVLLASLASGVLVVSNLTNLLAASHLSLQNSDFLRHLALPSLAASVVGWFAYR
ncbi:MAG: arsenical pump rane protein, partial [Actinomycetota bacterium]|nr:arsenical pump rane protein [Actinomycetota bacterium]